jgi:hypothetical protein
MNQFDNSLAPKQTPKAFVIGDYVAWRNSSYVTDYAPASYTLAYTFRREGEPAKKFVVTASEDNSEFLFEIDSSTSAGIDEGLYFWDLQVTRISDSERATLDQGTLTVQANKSSASGDPRTLPRKMIAEIERALLSRASNNQLDTLAYSLGVETSATRDTEKLNNHRDYWRRELIKANRKWRARNGKRHSGFIRAQF